MTTNTTLCIDNDYSLWLCNLKKRLRSSQLKAAMKVNEEMLQLYWSIGEELVKLKVEQRWGSGILKQIAQDLHKEAPNIKGFSEKSLYYMRRWYAFYSEAEKDFPQLVGKIKNLFFSVPWGHHRLILDTCKSSPQKAVFFLQQTVENGWSRNVLLNMLDTDLYERQGKAVNNFTMCLPPTQSDLAQQILRDPYTFDFLTLQKGYSERELEDALTDNITQFLLRLGKGFAYVGRQVNIVVGDKDFYIDLLFYHLQLRCYVVVELKTGDFEPEYAGKLSFYVSAVNHQLRHKDDAPTIGLIICKSRNEVIARYSLENISEPIGISQYKLGKLLPSSLQDSLPSIEELEQELSDRKNKQNNKYKL